MNAVQVLVDDRPPEVVVADDRSANAAVKIALDEEVPHLYWLAIVGTGLYFIAKDDDDEPRRRNPSPTTVYQLVSDDAIVWSVSMTTFRPFMTTYERSRSSSTS